MALESKNICIFTKEVNKIGSSASDDKRKQSLDSTGGTSEKTIPRIEEIRYSNIIKQHGKWLTMAMLRKKI